jgi:hypothetical protein
MFPMKCKSLIVALIGATSALTLPGRSDPPARAILPPVAIAPTHAKKAPVVRDFGRLPLSFERNQGQTDATVRFLTHSNDSTLFLTPSEAVFTPSAPLSVNSTKRSALGKTRIKTRTGTKIAPSALRMQMVGANPNAGVLQQQPLPGRINYFLGNDPRKWHADVPTFGRVGFHQVYPGVDVVYYGNQKHLEYDFLVAPHADPKQIQLHFAGAQKVSVNAAGDLVVRTQGRELRWQKPTVYQQNGIGKQLVAARFRLKTLPSGQTGVSFALGPYNSNRALIIDPVLSYSSYLGGSGYASHIAVDNAGNAYVLGFTSSTDFPTTPGAFQRVNNAAAGSNAVVTKFNSTGTTLLYSTYLGGSGNPEDDAFGLAVDSSGNAYIAGSTKSTDFPTTPGAFQRVNNAGAGGNSAFVTKLNSTGTALLYSTYLGGTLGGSAHSIAIDSGGNAYVTGGTISVDFPTTSGAFQRVNNGGGGSGNAYVTKLNSTGTALVYSTYLGGSLGAGTTGIAIDSGGNAYVTGYTTDRNFPTTPGAFQRSNHVQGMYPTTFVAKLDSTGSALVYSTYLGGSEYNEAFGIAVDSSGNAYVAGYTSAADFPTTPGAFQGVNNALPSYYSNVFVTKFNSTGTALLYSTYLGGGNEDVANSLAVDSSGNAYVAGVARSTDFPTTQGAFQRVNKGQGSPASNAFVTKFNSTGTALLYSTYLGGSDGASAGDSALGITVDRNGNAYVTGVTASADFPTTSQAFRTTKPVPNGQGTFVTKLSTVPIFPDFNNDGNTDLLIQNASTNAIASWFMNGSTWISGAYFSLTPPSDFALVGAGDFSGNGATTLVLQSSITNQIAYWYTSGADNATIPGGNFVNTTPAAGWKVVGVGDFNGDGKSDLVFQNQTTHQIAVWFMNGYLYQGGVLLPVSPLPGWNVVGTGDFNADGLTDLVFQNQTTGQIALWYMNGTTYVGGTVLTTVPASGWKVVGVGDYNGDGSADLLFQNQTSNQAAVWYLNSGSFLGSSSLSLNPPPGWKIVGPR